MQKPFLVVTSLISLLSCQITTNVAKNFKQSQTEWQSLASSATQLYKHHQLNLTGKVIWEEVEWGRKVSLTGFSFIKTEDIYRLNLLNPSFTQLYACGWYCEQLNEVHTNSLGVNFTYLSKLYNGEHKVLLNFYDRLIEIESNINGLNLSKEQLALRFLKLKISKNEFSTLNEIADFIEQSLTSETAIFNTIEQEVVNSNENSEVNSSSTPTLNATKDEAVQVSTHIEDRMPIESNSEIDTLDSNLKVLSLSQLICSYKNNYFGEVIELSSEKVAVQIIGQAKYQAKGEIKDRPEGYLFQQIGDFSYIELSEIKIFNRTEVDVCQVIF